MFATPTQFTEFQKSQMDALYALSHVAFNATEKLVDLNLTAAKAAMDESANAAQSLLGARDPRDLASVGGTLAQPAMHKFVGYGSNLFNIVSSASAEWRRVIETQIADGNTRATQFIEFATRNAPAGSEPMVSMFKNALAAYNTAYDSLSSATKQAFDMAESNLASATQNAVSAVAPEAETAKPRGKKGE